MKYASVKPRMDGRESLYASAFVIHAVRPAGRHCLHVPSCSFLAVPATPAPLVEPHACASPGSPGQPDPAGSRGPVRGGRDHGHHLSARGRAPEPAPVGAARRRIHAPANPRSPGRPAGADPQLCPARGDDARRPAGLRRAGQQAAIGSSRDPQHDPGGCTGSGTGQLHGRLTAPVRCPATGYPAAAGQRA